jgi:hypothetical protein
MIIAAIIMLLAVIAFVASANHAAAAMPTWQAGQRARFTVPALA